MAAATEPTDGGFHGHQAFPCAARSPCKEVRSVCQVSPAKVFVQQPFLSQLAELPQADVLRVAEIRFQVPDPGHPLAEIVHHRIERELRYVRWGQTLETAEVHLIRAMIVRRVRIDLERS